MRKVRKFLPLLFAAVTLPMFVACNMTKLVSAPPVAQSTMPLLAVNALQDANRYEIGEEVRVMSSVSAESDVLQQPYYVTKVSSTDGSFSFARLQARAGGALNSFTEANGVVTVGTLGYTGGLESAQLVGSPEEIAKKVAIYKLIEEARKKGADALLEPIITTEVKSVETRSGANAYIVNGPKLYTTEIVAKIVKIKK